MVPAMPKRNSGIQLLVHAPEQDEHRDQKGVFLAQNGDAEKTAFQNGVRTPSSSLKKTKSFLFSSRFGSVPLPVKGRSRNAPSTLVSPALFHIPCHGGRNLDHAQLVCVLDAHKPRLRGVVHVAGLDAAWKTCLSFLRITGILALSARWR